MPKEVRFPIRIDGLNDLEGLVSALKKVKAAADDANKSGATGTRAPSAKQTFANLGIPSVPYVSPKPPFIEIDKMMPKAGRIGGGSMGSLGMGAAAGATAAGVLMLGKVMKEMVQQSKIANTLQKNANKAMGLLVDLVLLPFLPLLVYGIIQLYSGIIAFSNWWQSIWDTIKKEGLFGLIKLGLEWVWQQVEEWVQNLIKWFFGPDTPAQKVIDLVIGLKTLLGGIFAWLGEQVIGALIDFIFGQGTTEKIKTATLNLALAFLGDPLGWLAYAVGYVFGATLHIMKDVLELGLSIINSTIAAIWDFAVWIWEVLTGKTKVDVLEFLISLIPKDPGGMLWGFIKWAMAGGAGLISKFLEGSVAGYNAVADVSSANGSADLPYLDTGGFVKETGVAVVHKGETVTPAGASSSGNTYNFYGYDDKSLQSKVKSIIRQEGTRYML